MGDPTPLLSEEDQKRIAAALKERDALKPCPRCGHETWHLEDGYFAFMTLPDLVTFRTTGPAVPSVMVFCRRCGFMSFHSLGMLGLSPTEPKGDPAEEPKEPTDDPS